ncbi:hypothetical protein Bca52824_014718 [Brassica carinata]|uniref:Uncharacterized protein n=1 Tax=Brassica carinata TaxID=52824 RepID=A0A8X8B3P7_BRACI|nr:hypothetical protein Bca52824_014718 [Brassica carinata]
MGRLLPKLASGWTTAASGLDETACEVQKKWAGAEDAPLEEVEDATMRIMISIYGMILLDKIANEAMIRMRMEGRWWCSSERNIWRLCVVRWRKREWAN